MKPARLDAGHLVDLHAGPGLHQLVDRAAEGARIAEQSRDVTEYYAGIGIVRDRADGVGKVAFEVGHWSLAGQTKRRSGFIAANRANIQKMRIGLPPAALRA